MDKFEQLFGVKQSSIKPSCIICPGNDVSLFANNNDPANKGLLFTVHQTSNSSIISTKNNFLTGDCILNLKDTPCERIYLFGSCGGISPTNIGDKFLVEKSYALESPSQMLGLDFSPNVYQPDKPLNQLLAQNRKDIDISFAACATVGSIELETYYKQWFRKNNVSIVDMEASIVFSTAHSIGRRATALLYVTDIISGNSPFDPISKEERLSIARSRKSLSKCLLSFIKNNAKS